MELSPFLVVILIFFVVVVIFNAIRIVPEYERLVVLALGRYAGTRGPGITFLIPFIETAKKVDLRERFLEIPRQTAISKDNTTIDIDFLVYYRIVDPKLSILTIDDVVRASLNIAATTLRAVIGDIDLDDVLAKREQINDTLRVKLDEVTERWGLKVTRVEIREVEPPADVQEAMNRQMSAERSRRAAVTQAEGERQAAITVAEGDKQSSILKAEGQKQAAILQAEGERQAQLLRAQGYSAGLKVIEEEAHALNENTLLLQYLETLRTVGSSASTKFVVPMEVTGLMQRLNSAMSNGNGNGSGEGSHTP
jgi:regulator of protease activity HflC (stomatin/prohibitin superfamily)